MFSAPVIWQPPPSVSSQSTVLVDICGDDPEFSAVEEEMQSTIREHRDQVNENVTLICKDRKEWVKMILGVNMQMNTTNSG